MGAFRALPEVDRLLALGLAIYEESRCSGCGEWLHESMDPDLLDEWTTTIPHRCGACTALARASDDDRDKGRDHPGALRRRVGLRQGWEQRKAQAVAEREARAAREE